MFLYSLLGRLFLRSVARNQRFSLGLGLLALLTVIGLAHHFLPGSVAGKGRPAEQTRLGLPLFPEAGVASAPATAPNAKLHQSVARMSLCFEANHGQTDKQVDYLARGPGYTLFLTPTEAVMTLRSDKPVPAGVGKRHSQPTSAPSSQAAVVRMELLGARAAAHAAGVDPLAGQVNYFRGKDPSQWQTGIPTYARVHYADVYPGIGLVYYGNQQQLEYDFQIAPGADPSQIRLAFAGAQHVGVDSTGDLVLWAGGQELRQHRPVAYQEIGGVRREVEAEFIVQGERVAFAVGHYDPNQPLIIDPTLSYSTYLGGSGDDVAYAIALDAAGDMYLTGWTSSPDFPTLNPFQPQLGGNQSAFVAKLTPDGCALVYGSYLGGSGQTGSPFAAEGGLGIAVNAAGNAYVTGYTSSPDFPTANPLQPTFGGGDFGDAFVAKLTADGSALVYATYLGGRGADFGYRLAVDDAGNAYLTGSTTSPDFPTVNPLQPAYGGGGTTWGDAFVAKLSADGSALVYATYLGGRGQDVGWAIAVDAAGAAYVTGYTNSLDFPTANPMQPALGGQGVYNAFVAMLAADGSTLVYSTYLGGSVGEGALGIAVDAASNAYVTGYTSSPDFPTANALQPHLGGADATNCFVAKISP
jgi:hypothetical protein